MSSVATRSEPGGADATVKAQEAADAFAGALATRISSVPLLAAKSTLRPAPAAAQMSRVAGAGGAEPTPACSRGVGLGEGVREGEVVGLAEEGAKATCTSAPLKPRLLLDATKASVSALMPLPLTSVRGAGSTALAEAQVTSAAPPGADPLYTTKAAAPGSTASARGVSVMVKPGASGSPSSEKVQEAPGA